MVNQAGLRNFSASLRAEMIYEKCPAVAVAAGSGILMGLIWCSHILTNNEWVEGNILTGKKP